MQAGRGGGSMRGGGRSARVARWAVPLLLAAAAQAAADERPKRFLMLHASHSTLVANVAVAAGAIATFDAALGPHYEAFAEYRDDQRFPGPEADRAFADSMAMKYRGKAFDAVIALGPSALRFVLDHPEMLHPDAPVVVAAVTATTLDGLAPPPDFHFILNRFSIPDTLALARRLQPRADRVVVVAGSGAFDRSWLEHARRELAGLQGLAVEFLTDRTLAQMRSDVAALDRDDIVIALTIFEDAAGAQFSPMNAAAVVAASSAAPVWSVYDSYIGRGIVGGDVQRFRDIGALAAETALRLAAGETDVPRLIEPPSRPVLDWRQMTRHGLDRARLPPDAALEFYEPTAWERYRWQILLATAVILAQSATIAGLVVQGRRRRTAEREVAARRVEVAHMSRVAQLGELSGALAHELNQPLTSILANAEAGAKLVARDPVDATEIAAILADIAEDDRRAAAVIGELRRLMTRTETAFEALDLNEVAASTMRLTKYELLVREVRAEAELAAGALPIRGRRAQLQQVLLNLMLNAADAMADQPAATRRMTVATRLRPDGWRELSVADAGPGLAAAVAADPFRPFATTKANGLGLGLSICRTIAGAHGGTLDFDGAATQGARVVLALPPP